VPTQATALRSIAAPVRRRSLLAAPAEYAPDLKWDLLLLCVAGHVMVAVGRVHQLFPAVGALRPAILTGLLATTLFLIDRQHVRQTRELFVPTMKLVMAFLFWMVLSVPGAIVLGNSADLVFGNFAKTVLMSLVLAGAVRGLRDIERLAAVYLAAAVTYACVVVARFDLGGGPDWRLGRLYYYDANDLATFLVTAMPLAAYFLLTGRRAVDRILAVGALAILTVAFARTGSRGGFIALVAVVIFFVTRYSAISLGRRVSAAVLIAVILLGTASDRYWQQMAIIASDDDYNRTEETGRLQIWSRGVGYMMRHPLLGVGPNNFQTAEGTLSPLAERQQFGVGVRWNAPHNTYIEVGAETGLVGLLLFVAMIASTFAALRRSRLRDPGADPRDRRTQLAQVLTASLIGFVVGAFFLTLAYAEMLYTLIALAIGLQKVAAAQDREPGAAAVSLAGARAVR
jgi:putative inorganic carbon (HCO3(-)) transporter